MYLKQGYALKSWVEQLSDEVFYLGVTKKNQLKFVNPSFATEQKKVSIHRLQVFQNHTKQAKIKAILIVFHH